MVRKVLLVCGILSSLLYVSADVLCGMRYEGYSFASQTISELSAIGAPTRPLWVVLVIAYTLLVAAFGWGVWASAGRSRTLRVVGGLMIVYGVIGLAWPFASMHQRAVLAAGGGTLSDALHIIGAGVDVFFIMLIVGFGSAAFGKRFSLYSIGTIVILLVFGALTGMDGPRIQANLPTPWVGVMERISVHGSMLWFAVLAIALLRAPGKRPQDPRGL